MYSPTGWNLTHENRRIVARPGSRATSRGAGSKVSARRMAGHAQLIFYQLPGIHPSAGQPQDSHQPKPRSMSPEEFPDLTRSRARRWPWPCARHL